MWNIFQKYRHQIWECISVLVPSGPAVSIWLIQRANSTHVDTGASSEDQTFGEHVLKVAPRRRYR